MAVTEQDVISRLNDGKLRPVGTSYAGMTTEQIAVEYLRRCKECHICAGCNNPLTTQDMDLLGFATNECIFCACY